MTLGMIPLQVGMRLPRREARILHVMSDGAVWPIGALARAIYGEDRDNHRQAIFVAIHKTRKSIAGTGAWIETTPSVGYRLTGIDVLAAKVSGVRLAGGLRDLAR